MPATGAHREAQGGQGSSQHEAAPRLSGVWTSGGGGGAGRGERVWIVVRRAVFCCLGWGSFFCVRRAVPRPTPNLVICRDLDPFRAAGSLKVYRVSFLAQPLGAAANCANVTSRVC